MRSAALTWCALVLLAATPASAHRLDEYLQATTIALEKQRVQIDMRLAPGVEVFPAVLGDIDRDSDGVASEAEQQAYPKRVLSDIALTADGTRIPLRLVSSHFPPPELLQSGRGEIQLRFEATLYGKAVNRKLTFENHHQSRISSYLVNGLVPQDPDIKLSAQQRSYDQSLYQLEYTGPRETATPFASWLAAWEWTDGVLLALAVISLILVGRRLQDRPVP
jgi:hypothetical protein